jgi:hypothetical protein
MMSCETIGKTLPDRAASFEALGDVLLHAMCTIRTSLVCIYTSAILRMQVERKRRDDNPPQCHLLLHKPLTDATRKSL